MAVVGRKPMPRELKLLHGNPGKHPLPPKAPKARPVAPRMPAWLCAEAKAEWKRIAKPLERLGLLTEADGAAFTALCQAYGRWVQAERALSKGKLTVDFKTGYAQQRAEVGIAKAYLSVVRAFCAEFGLTPSSRGRIQMPGEEGEDEFSEFMP